jgi:hypothetical protein
VVFPQVALALIKDATFKRIIGACSTHWRSRPIFHVNPNNDRNGIVCAFALSFVDFTTRITASAFGFHGVNLLPFSLTICNAKRINYPVAIPEDYICLVINTVNCHRQYLP